ncbi:MAG: hypothetical protein WC546_05055 [Candidatus Omnitrophota bacterium]
MLTRKKKSKAQAMVELAILGPLLLMAAGFVVTYVCKMNNDQFELMEAFRKAIAKAHDTNKVTSYGTWDDRRMANISEPIIGQKTTSSGSACVHWAIEGVTGEQDDKTESTTVVKVNMPEYDLGEGGSGGIEPLYITGKGSSVTINSVNNVTSSTHSGGVGEFMLYKINNRNYPQGRGSGSSRSFSATLSGGK